MSDVVTSLANHTSAETSRDNATQGRTVVVAILVAVGYYFTAKIGFAFALQPGSVSTLWMPNSILLAGLLLVPRRSWWIILRRCLSRSPCFGISKWCPDGDDPVVVHQQFFSGVIRCVFHLQIR